MNRMKGSRRARRRLLAAIGALVAAAGMMPLFGSTAYAAGVSLNNVVSIAQFSLPGAPLSRTSGAVPPSGSLPAPLALADDVVGLFPNTGELLLGETELIEYEFDTNKGSPGNQTACGAIANNQVCVTARAKVGQEKSHPTGTPAKLATHLTPDPISGTPAQGNLLTAITAAQTPPFPISVTSEAAFGASGYLTISHQDTDAFGPTAEFFAYDRSCGSASQLCLTARALQANNLPSAHPANGYAQPGGTPGRSIVDKHVQIQVESNAGFFPSRNLLVFNVDANNNITNAELLAYSNAATKIKTPGPTEFHVTARGVAASPFKKTLVQTHLPNSIVTGADTFLVCRTRFESPLPAGDPQGATNSAGAFAVCYEQFQPNGPPKQLTPTKQLLVPLMGQPIIVLNALNQLFLSTGGFCHLLFGPVGTGGNCSAQPPIPPAPVDTNGTKDNVLRLTTPCIVNYTPGVNFQVDAVLQTSKNLATPFTGDVTVVQDTTTGPGGGGDLNPATHDDCDDPAGTSDGSLTAYDAPGGSDPTGTGDDDTDGDGCDDREELDNNKGTGGQRDPWNSADFFDTNLDKAVTTTDIFKTAAKFGKSIGQPGYSAAHDRGTLGYGPFAHNLSGADGAIAAGDIFASAAQFGHNCTAV